MNGNIRIIMGAILLIAGDVVHCLPLLVTAAVVMGWGLIANLRNQ